MKNRRLKNLPGRHAAPAWATVALAALAALAGPSAAAIFITADRTVEGGNLISGNYSGN